MGCTTSREARRERRNSPSPYFRSHSMPIHHVGSPRKKPQRPAGSSRLSRHLVNLTSSTLGSIKLDSDDESMMKSTNDGGITKKKPTTAAATVAAAADAKAWSEMIETKIPKPALKSPRSSNSEDRQLQPAETINAWELMEGLEEPAATVAGVRCFSFSHAERSPRPLWMQLSAGESIVSDFDPEIISNFRKALEELSPQHQQLLRSPEPGKKSCRSSPEHGNKSITNSCRSSPEPEKRLVTTLCRSSSSEVEKKSITTLCRSSSQPETPNRLGGIVKARVSAFQQRIDDAKKRGRKQTPPGGEKKVVMYFTSLRGIRKTYEDCWGVRVILQGYGVKVDERDVSMHAGFKAELNEILGDGEGGKRTLPRVFANGRYLGGAEEVRQMHEAGELGRVLEECEVVAVGKGGGEGCDGCGDVRFVPCETCSGSCKVFVEEVDEEVGEVAGFRRCPDCNENGLVRCPMCF